MNHSKERLEDWQKRYCRVCLLFAKEFLPPREKIIFERRLDDKTLKEIGEEIGVSKERVRGLEYRACRTIGNIIGSDPIKVWKKREEEKLEKLRNECRFQAANKYHTEFKGRFEKEYLKKTRQLFHDFENRKGKIREEAEMLAMQKTTIYLENLNKGAENAIQKSNEALGDSPLAEAYLDGMKAMLKEVNKYVEKVTF